MGELRSMSSQWEEGCYILDRVARERSVSRWHVDLGFELPGRREF